MKQYEIYNVDFGNNGIGSEQQGVRPAIIIQNDVGNKYSPTTIVVPLTSRKTKHSIPTHCNITSCPKSSIALCEQIMTIDKVRVKEYINKLTTSEIQSLQGCLRVSIDIFLENNKIEKKGE